MGKSHKRWKRLQDRKSTAAVSTETSTTTVAPAPTAAPKKKKSIWPRKKKDESAI